MTRDNDAHLTWAQLVRVSAKTLGAVEAELKAANMPPLVWYDALLALRRAGDCGLRQFELEREILLVQYSLSRLSDRLEKAGFVVRKSCPQDSRGHHLVITDSGLALVERMRPVCSVAVKAHFTHRLEPFEITKLAEILGRFSDENHKP